MPLKSYYAVIWYSVSASNVYQARYNFVLYKNIYFYPS